MTLTHEEAIDALAETCAKIRQSLVDKGYELGHAPSPSELQNALDTMEEDGKRLALEAGRLRYSLSSAVDKEANAGPRL